MLSKTLLGFKEISYGVVIRWKPIYKPKDQGGLGVKHCEMFNLSLLSKWKLCILNVVNVLRPRFLPLRYGDIK